MTDKQTCKDLVRSAYRSRMSEIKRLWKGYRKGDEDLQRDWSEYGLCFDYVTKGTFKDQGRGYFRFQISWGGPSEEFRFFCDECLDLDRIEFWYLNWFDGAKVSVTGSDRETWKEIWQDWMDCDLQKNLIRKSADET